ncbi:MAG: ThiF family adenylyltransferase [Planctomycetes bacterium]|nr:ThiF family adenylyltransferase [Planctomycetota bacterium]
MSLELFNRNADLKRLRDEGYFVQVRGGLLLMREVPYVNADRQVRLGTLVSTLTMAGEVTQRPDTHVACFDGDYPCNADGTPLKQISHQSGRFDLGHGVVAKHKFSSKPAAGYTDYYEKMTTYAAILSGPAAVLQPDASPRTFGVPGDEEESVFHYTDTASARVGIGALSEKLACEVLAIIGLGGTGSYVLDLVAKTPVREIRLFDGDEFLQHNAFRAPGAPTIDELREAPLKVEYLSGIYSQMHRKIVSHGTLLNAENLNLLEGVTFAFLCMDGGPAKQLVVEKLESLGAAFVDVGMGLELVERSLGGILRVTASTPEKREHVRERVSFATGAENDVYLSNIQVADLNSLNAALAVIKWKKLRGFYRDLEQEHHCTYTTDGNLLLNGDQHATPPAA